MATWRILIMNNETPPNHFDPCNMHIDVRQDTSEKITLCFTTRTQLSNKTHFQGYKVYYTTNPQLPMTQWQSQKVDSNHLTTISELTPHTVYTIRVQAFTSVGPGPLSAPVHVKTQQGTIDLFTLS